MGWEQIEVGRGGGRDPLGGLGAPCVGGGTWGGGGAQLGVSPRCWLH